MNNKNIELRGGSMRAGNGKQLQWPYYKNNYIIFIPKRRNFRPVVFFVL